MNFTITITSPGNDPVSYEIEAASALRAKLESRRLAAKHVTPAAIVIRHPDYPLLSLRALSATAPFYWCAGGIPTAPPPAEVLSDWGLPNFGR